MGVPSFGKGFFWALFNTSLSDFVDTKKRLPFNYWRVHSFCQISPHNWFNVNFLIGKVLEVFCFSNAFVIKKGFEGRFSYCKFFSCHIYIYDKSTLCNFLNINEPFAQSRYKFFSKIFCNIRKVTWLQLESNPQSLSS